MVFVLPASIVKADLHLPAVPQVALLTALSSVMVETHVTIRALSDVSTLPGIQVTAATLTIESG